MAARASTPSVSVRTAWPSWTTGDWKAFMRACGREREKECLCVYSVGDLGRERSKMRKPLYEICDEPFKKPNDGDELFPCLVFYFFD